VSTRNNSWNGSWNLHPRNWELVEVELELCEGSASVRQVFWEEGSQIAGLLVLFWRRLWYTKVSPTCYGSRCRRCVGVGGGGLRLSTNLNLREGKAQAISTGVSGEPRMTDHNQNVATLSHLTLAGKSLLSTRASPAALHGMHGQLGMA
jgi:hypothetical protein